MGEVVRPPGGVRFVLARLGSFIRVLDGRLCAMCALSFNAKWGIQNANCKLQNERSQQQRLWESRGLGILHFTICILH